jgi:hypothetical protein
MTEPSQRDTIGMLDGVPLFAGLTKRQLAAVAKLVDHERFEPGHVLVKEMVNGRSNVASPLSVPVMSWVSCR